MTDLVKFWRALLGSPGAVGSVAPSSAALGRRMVEWVDWERAGTVIECGPGTGALTGAILSSLHPGARFLAVEVNPSLASVFRQRFPGVALAQESAVNLPALCAERGMETVDCILSGLPWAAFPRRTQGELLTAMTRVLGPGGQFVTFAYLQGLLLPRGRRFRGLLPAYFSEVSQSAITWRNLPPAFVYRCRR